MLQLSCSQLQVQILSMLDHPNIISYYDSFEEDGVLMIEMEYADGGWVSYDQYCMSCDLYYRTLAQFLRQQTKPIPEQEVLSTFAEMVDALKYLHDHKILHRWVTSSHSHTFTPSHLYTLTETSRQPTCSLQKKGVSS